MDLHEVYNSYLNLCKTLEENKDTTHLHDYLWFLQNMDKFDDFAINRKIKFQSKYAAYLNMLYEHLSSFFKRSRPLDNFGLFEHTIMVNFEDKYAKNKVIGWDST